MDFNKNYEKEIRDQKFHSSDFKNLKQKGKDGKFRQNPESPTHESAKKQKVRNEFEEALFADHWFFQNLFH